MTQTMWFPDPSFQSIDSIGSTESGPSQGLVTETFTPVSSGSWVVPGNVTSVFVEVVGSGGNGGDGDPAAAGDGGGGGEYAAQQVAVTPGDTITYLVDAGGNNGVTTWDTGGASVPSAFSGSAGFNSGAPGIGGSNGAGTLDFSGGYGGIGNGGDPEHGGGGGSSGGPGGNGGTGQNGPSGGHGAPAPTGGGAGGAGGATTVAGSNGTVPGGGGGGGGSGAASPAHGIGGDGRIRITYAV